MCKVVGSRKLHIAPMSVPFLTIKTLNHLAEEERDKLPNAAQVVQWDFYVDDILTGSDSLGLIPNYN